MRKIYLLLILIISLSNLPIVGSDNNIDDQQQIALKLLKAKRDHLQKEVEQHRRELKQYIPQRRITEKKLKTTPQAKYAYSCGLHLLKALKEVEEEIFLYSGPSSKEKKFEECDHFLDNLQNNINQFYKQSADTLTQELITKKNAQSCYKTEVKNSWFWYWITFSITLQAICIPTYAEPLQNQPSRSRSITPEAFTCPRFLTNGTLANLTPLVHSDVMPMPLVAPLGLPQIDYIAPQLGANAKAMQDSIDCYSNQNSGQKTGDRYDCLKSVFDKIPDYGNLDIWQNWYTDIQFLPGGRVKDIFTAYIKQARGNLLPGTKIIILAKGMLKKDFFFARDMLNHCQHLSILSNYEGKVIVGYYASFYGAYFGDKLSSGSYGLPIDIRQHGIDFNKRTLYNEMEYVDIRMSFYDLNENFSDHIPDNIVFETDLGEWASIKIAKISHGDSYSRHNVIGYVDYYRAYHIGQEIYLFEPGLTPKLIDLDTLNTNEVYSGFYSSKFNPNYKFSPEVKKAVKEMQLKGIFTVFSQYFHKYKVSAQNPIPLSNVRHFYVPDNYLDQM